MHGLQMPSNTVFSPVETEQKAPADLPIYAEIRFTHQLFDGKPLVVPVPEAEYANFTFNFAKSLRELCARQHIGGTHHSTITADFRMELYEDLPDGLRPADIPLLISEIKMELAAGRHTAHQANSAAG